MEHKMYSVITGDQLFEIDEKAKSPIVEGLLNHQDYIMIVAEEKQGKTILSQQLACSMSVGKPFLGIFDIPRPVRVWYFATEGRVNDLKARFIRISQHTGIDKSMIKLIPSSFRFNSKEGENCLVELVETTPANEAPDVIIVDALYRAINGSLKDDDKVNEFHHVVGKLSSFLNCAVILVHHMTKPSRSENGTYYKRTDKDMFGSAFLSAAVDHIFWIEKYYKGEKNEKLLRCDTQRSGEIIEDVRLQLESGDSLYFKPVGIYAEDEEKILNIICREAGGLSFAEIQKLSKINGRTKLYSILKSLENSKAVTKVNGRPVVYKKY